MASSTSSESCAGSRRLLLRVYALTLAWSLIARMLVPSRLGPVALRLSRPRRGARPERADVDRLLQAVDHVQSSGWPLIRRGCLSRGLTLFHLLRRSGMQDVSLAFGVGLIEDALEGHCWLVRDRAPYLEARPDVTDRFREVWVIAGPEVATARA